MPHDEADAVALIKDNPQQLIIFQTSTDNIYVSENGGKIAAVIIIKAPSAYITLSDDCDVQEIAVFLQYNGALSEICGKSGDIDTLLPHFPQAEADSYTVAVLEDEPKVFLTQYDVREASCFKDLEKVYALLKDEGLAEVPFDEYYVKRRKDIDSLRGRTYAAFDGETLICTASTVYETKKQAFIGGVATLPEYRNRGIAKAVLSVMCRVLYDEDIKTAVAYMTPQANALYKSVGFKDVLNCKRIK